MFKNYAANAAIGLADLLGLGARFLNDIAESLLTGKSLAAIRMARTVGSK